MSSFTSLLTLAGGDDDAATAKLWQAAYDELRKMAAARMSGERRQVTLQPTVLVHEVWLKLAGGANAEKAVFENRAHFFTAAGEAMRRILVDQARRRLSQKRGAGEELVPLDSLEIAAGTPDEKLLEVHEVLDELATVEPRQAEVVRLHFFAGLKHGEIAGLLGIGESTVRREWTLAKNWLYQAIRQVNP